MPELYTMGNDYAHAIDARHALVIGQALDGQPLSPERFSREGAPVVDVAGHGPVVFGARWELDALNARRAALGSHDAAAFLGLDQAVEAANFDLLVRAPQYRKTFALCVERYVDLAGHGDLLTGEEVGRVFAALLPHLGPGRDDPVMACSLELMAAQGFTEPVAVRRARVDADLRCRRWSHGA